MVNSLATMAKNTERTGRRMEPLQLIRHGFLITPLLMGNAYAGENTTYHFNLPVQPMSATLDDLAQSAHTKLVYADESVKGLNAAPVKGNYTARQALNIALDNSGLNYKVVDKTLITVARKPEADSSTSETTLKPMRVVGEAVQDQHDPYNEDYHIIDATTATKTDASIMQTPMNIQVVPKAIINDQQDINIVDAITRNVSGVQADHGSGDIYENFIIRGFQTQGDTYRNGLLRNFGTFDPANMEQIEVIKGPASMLYGRAQPGGLVNYVTKKGLDTPYYSVQQQFGSYDKYRTTVDATGPIDKNDELRYRVNFSYQDIGSFKQFVNNERSFIAPTLSWKPNDRFEANLEMEYKHEDKVNDWGIPSIGTRPAPVPLSRSYQDSAKPMSLENTLVAYDWAFKFNDDWKVKNRFLWENQDIQYYDTGNEYLDADNRTLHRFIITGPANTETFSTNLDLTGKFDLVGSKHEVLVGGDFYNNTYQAANNRYGNYGSDRSFDLPTIDIFNPVYHIIDQALVNAQPFNWNYLRKENRYGVYFQDQITLFDKLHILGGGRYDWVNYGTGADFNDGGSFETAKAGYTDQEDQKFSPRVGLLYQPWQWLSVYGSYTESLGSANQGQSFSGQSFKPEEAEQYEVGFKTELLDKRLATTVSFYHLEKTNTTTNDPDHPGLSITAGKARSQGIEVDIKGQITEQLNLVTTYAFTDVRYIKANAPLQGQRPINVPEHQATLWGTYQLTPQFKAGIGGVLVGSRIGDNYDPVDLPGYVTMDVMAAYSIPVGDTRLTTQINLNNLLDKGYYTGAGYGRNSINTGEPLSVMGSVRLEY